MKRILLTFCLLLPLLSCTERDRYVLLSGYAQGGVYAVKVNLKGTSCPESVVRQAVDSILTLVDTTLSGYNKGSILSRFNAGEPVRPNALFLAMYKEAYHWYEVSEGAVDCAAGPLFDAWGFGFKTDSLPSAEKVARLLSTSGMKHLREEMDPLVGEDGFLDPASLVRDPGVPSPVLNYNAIAQGYTADLIASWLYGIGVRDMLVDIGEIWCDGLNPSRQPWSIGIDRPTDGNNRPGADLTGVFSSRGDPCGIVTSGNYRKFYVRDGKKYAHTIDPRTGFPTGHSLLSATLVVKPGSATPSSGEADALSTWCMVLGPEGAKKLIEERPNVTGFLVYGREDGSMEEWAAPDFPLTSQQ